MNPKKGVLIPRMTTAERNAIPSPANSLLIFNTDCNVLQIYIASTGKWYDILQNDYGPPSSISFANSISFNYTGNIQTWTVPNGVCWIKIKAWGAGGGGGASIADGSIGGRGGGGGYVEKFLKVTPGDVLTIYVGGGGTGGKTSAGGGGGAGGWGYGNGGNGGNAGSTGWSGAGGGGGGASAILHNGNLVLIAAGGGGGGGNGPCPPSPAAGGNGGSSNQNGGNGNATGGVSGAAGSFNGGNGANHGGDGSGGGGGGGGWNGGTGGSASPGDSAAGGGGGGINNCLGSGCLIMNGNLQTPGNSGDPDLCGGCAVGGNITYPATCPGGPGQGFGTNGGNGFVKIYY